jgi:ferredoxin
MTLGLEMSPSAAAADRATGLPVPDDIFVLEGRGWTSTGIECEPKVLALASLENLAPPDPVASVSYKSSGNLLVVAGERAERARRSAERLADALHVTLLQPGGAAAAAHVVAWSGRIESLSGYLGEFTATIAALARPGEPPAAQPVPARFDLVLDFSATPLFAMRQPPQGYWHASESDDALEAALAELREAVGEFDKPRFFAYRENICAHSRSQVVGCDKCIEICSAGAIASDGDHVKVDPHLCMGCGACSTVCPSGAMTYQYPRVADRGTQLKQLLSTYRHAGGTEPCILFHDGSEGRDLLAEAAVAGQGLPARVLPLETWHVAAVGLDLMLPAIAFGASQVAVLASAGADREYLRALKEQMAIGEAILAGLGRPGLHFALIEASDAAEVACGVAALDPAPDCAPPASFMVSGDKRTSIEFAVEHLAALAPHPVTEIALPAGAPYGEVRVDAKKCTLCMACVGACPESALMDGVDQPLLKFLERNCVQCGLCEATCPEDAITLSPRLLLGAAAREARVVNQAQPFHCIRCDKPFATRQIIDVMMGRLAGHSMFTGSGALSRLQMCADCRVIDMMSSKDEASVLGRRSES